MTNLAALHEIKNSLVENAGGYLRNTVHIAGETCSTCRGTQMRDGFHTCYLCERVYGPSTADALGSIIYGVSDTQSGKLMHQYKLPPPRPTLLQRVSSLVAVGVNAHFRCVELLIGQKPTRWATVPSLSNIGTDHPFHKLILGPLLGSGSEIVIAASDAARGKSEHERRQFNPDLYAVQSEVPAGAHVLLIDDTWTSGGHMQSVAALLKQHGATTVAALAVARWLDTSDARTKRIYGQHIKTRPYDPDVCPWTGGGCPTIRGLFSPP